MRGCILASGISVPISTVPFFRFNASNPLIMRSHQGHPAAVLVYPVVPLVFLVGEHGRGGLFLQSCGDGESARSGSNYDHIEEVWEGLWLLVYHCTSSEGGK